MNRNWKCLLCTSLAVSSLLLPLTASARVHDNSVRFRPKGLNLADVTGDRVYDWVGLKTGDGEGVSIELGDNTQQIRPLFGGGTTHTRPLYAQYTFVGRFSQTTKDDVCAYSILDDGYGAVPKIYCYEYMWGALYAFGDFSWGAGGSSGASGVMWAMPSQINRDSETRGFTVGDFDGDGRDEVLTYNRSNGSNVRFWGYDSKTGVFVQKTNIDLGTLNGFNKPGGIDAFAGELTNADASGARRDDLLLYNRSTHEVHSYVSVMSQGRPVFRSWLNEYAPLGANDEIAVANADGDAYDDLIAIDKTNGAMHFLNIHDWDNALTQLPNVVQGNISCPAGQTIRMMWFSSGVPRDEVLLYATDDWFYRYWAAKNGNQNTYWWSNSYTSGYVWSQIR